MKWEAGQLPHSVFCLHFRHSHDKIYSNCMELYIRCFNRMHYPQRVIAYPFIKSTGRACLQALVGQGKLKTRQEIELTTAKLTVTFPEYTTACL